MEVINPAPTKENKKALFFFRKKNEALRPFLSFEIGEVEEGTLPGDRKPLSLLESLSSFSSQRSDQPGRLAGGGCRVALSRKRISPPLFFPSLL